MTQDPSHLVIVTATHEGATRPCAPGCGGAGAAERVRRSRLECLAQLQPTILEGGALRGERGLRSAQLQQPLVVCVRLDHLRVERLDLPIDARQSLLDWSRLQWSENAPRCIGELADRVEAPLSDELRKLSAVSYGRGSGDWNGAPLADALRSVTIVAEHSPVVEREALPPLMPPAA